MVISRTNFIKIAGLAGAGLLFGSQIKGSLVSLQQELPSLMIDKNGNPVNSLSEWMEQRKSIVERWSNYLGILDPNPVPPKLRILKEEVTDGLIRQFIEYEGEPGIFVKAYLLKPQKITKPLPGAVALHSTSDRQMLFISGAEKGNIVALGYNLALRGFVVICPMCFLNHDRGDRTSVQQVEQFQMRHPRSKGMAKMLFDAQRAVDVLEGLKEVDKERIGALGHSLGGKEAFYLGAFDERVKAIVSNEGGIGIDFSNWEDPWYLGNEIHNFNHQHHELLALCAPRHFLLIGGDSADGKISIPYIEAVSPVYKLYGKPRNIKLFNHGQGHSIAPNAEKLTYKWMVRHL